MMCNRTYFIIRCISLLHLPLFYFWQSGSSTAPPQVDSTSSCAASTTSTTAATKVEEKKLLSKDSILSLYASSSVSNQPQSQQQPAAGQGIALSQRPTPFLITLCYSCWLSLSMSLHIHSTFTNLTHLRMYSKSTANADFFRNDDV